MRTGIVIQARTSSTRLPGKVLKDLPLGSGVPALSRVIERARRAHVADVVVVATSDREDDAPIAELAERAGVACFRGSLDDVLARCAAAAREHALERVIRVTGDCPCVDPAVVDDLAALQEHTGADFCTNVAPRSFLKGLDCELATMEALNRIDREATDRADREHVFTYAYRTAPERFRIANLEAPRGMRDPDTNVSLDTPADYALLCGVFDLLGSTFAYADLHRLFERHPWLRLVNSVKGTR